MYMIPRLKYNWIPFSHSSLQPTVVLTGKPEQGARVCVCVNKSGNTIKENRHEKEEEREPASMYC